MWTVILLTCLGFLLGIFYWQRRQQMAVFKRMGIPGPSPNFLFGNLLTFWKTPMFKQYGKWSEVFGKTYGYFEGPSPVIVTSDTDILSEVFVKQFKSFHARKIFPVQVDPDKDEEVHMFFARGERWRRLRSIANPAFNTGKMRLMSPMINKQIDKFLNVMDDKCLKEEEFNIYDLLQRLTFDTIAKCGFGLEADSVRTHDDEYLQNCRGVINDTTKRPILFMFGFIFPTLHRLWILIYYWIGKLKFNPVIWLENKLQTVVQNRKLSDKRDTYDLLELFLNSEYDPERTEMDQLSDCENNVKCIAKHRFLSTQELGSQCLLFLLSGYETTSTTLAYVMYEMAMNPDVQRILQEEIDKYYPDDDDKVEYDNVMKMEYLDMVLNETLRKYPLASTVIARQCMRTSKVGDFQIEPGMIVQANVWDLHYDKNVWGEDPTTFDPQRFSTENKAKLHPCAWMPFGHGPRRCVGLRLAQLEGKMTIVRTLKKFMVLPGKELDSELKIIEGATIFPQNGVQVRLVHRKCSLSDE
ncbi:putative cytochrome P450 CYP13A10 isoform X1 [Mercenaria mercenaria]|uniref:putative cytochrome P450 CYP13A10 isoform X1 n=1 Tax=Mercenaria mercenaria TaxID=6596 RepID=UPI00234EA151|nr:putative cytochrome P450 CYP13A10 isoform X1 [Mercenaria mercenaria]